MEEMCCGNIAPVEIVKVVTFTTLAPASCLSSSLSSPAPPQSGKDGADTQTLKAKASQLAIQ